MWILGLSSQNLVYFGFELLPVLSMAALIWLWRSFSDLFGVLGDGLYGGRSGQRPISGKKQLWVGVWASGQTIMG